MIRHIKNIKHYIQNFSWMMLANLIKILFGTLTTIYVIRYLGPKDFGLLSFALSIIGILYPLATLGLDSILFRNIIKNKDNESTLIITAFRMRLAFSILLFLILCIYLLFSNNEYTSNLLIVILFIGLIFNSVEVYKQYFNAIIQYKYISFSNIVAVIISSLLKILFIYLKLGVIWFAISVVIEKFIIFVTTKYFYHKKSNFKGGKYNNDVAKKILADSWTLMFTSFAGMMYIYSDQIIIKYFLDTEHVGLYAAPTKLLIFLFFIPSLISNIIYPQIMNLHENLKTEKFLIEIERIYFINFLLAIIIMIFLLLFGEWLILFLFGSEYLRSVDILYISSFGLIFIFFAGNNNKLLMIDNLQGLMLSRNIIGLAINLIFNLILIPIIGIKGAAYSTLLTQAFIMCSYYLNFKTRYIFWLQLKIFFYPISLVIKKIKS